MCSLACLKVKTEEKPEKNVFTIFYFKNCFAHFWKKKKYLTTFFKNFFCDCSFMYSIRKVYAIIILEVPVIKKNFSAHLTHGRVAKIAEFLEFNS